MKKIKIYADGASIEDIKVTNKNELVSGFTTNPSLMLSAGVKPRTFDDLNDAEKARYTDLLLKRQALEAMLTARIFPFELDATK